ncbi:MAG: tetratricopeptide repeat protein [Myxococcota bacterium]
MSMSNWVLWMILSRLTGSPIGSAIAILLGWFIVDRFTLGVLPDPLRPFLRWRRRSMLERTVAHNPHDGRARLELAQLYVERNRGKDAVEVLRPNFDRGADDIQSVFTMADACLQAGFVEQGEKLFAHAEELDHDFRAGEIFLVRGRHRLARGDFAGAKTDLETLVKLRTGTVQGRVLLARAHRGLGDDASAVLLEDKAWDEFVMAPRFLRRAERLWAWRAKPSRPATYLLVVVLVLATCGTVVVPKLSEWSRVQYSSDGSYTDPGLADPDE